MQMKCESCHKVMKVKGKVLPQFQAYFEGQIKFIVPNEMVVVEK